MDTFNCLLFPDQHLANVCFPFYFRPFQPSFCLCVRKYTNTRRHKWKKIPLSLLVLIRRRKATRVTLHSIAFERNIHYYCLQHTPAQQTHEHIIVARHAADIRGSDTTDPPFTERHCAFSKFPHNCLSLQLFTEVFACVCLA